MVVASSTSPRNALSEINMASASNKAMKLAHAPTIPRAASQPADMHEYWSATASTSALPRASSSNDLNRRGDREEELEIMMAMMLSNPDQGPAGSDGGKRKFGDIPDHLEVQETPSFFEALEIDATPSFFDVMTTECAAH